MLEALDVGTTVGRVYTALVANPNSTEDQLTAAAGLSTGDVRAALQRLRDDGMTTVRQDVDPPTWEAEPPDRRVDEQLAKARRTGQELSRLHWMARRATERYPGLEVLRDPVQVQDQYRTMITMARNEVRSLNRPPFLTVGVQGAVDAQIADQRASLRSGVAYKAIWWEGLFDDPVASASAMATMAAGEQARMLTDLPMKLFIVDDQRAMLPLDPSDLTDGATLVIHPSGLLAALNALFDTLWNLSAPITTSAGTRELTDQDRAILSLLVAGAGDATIARRLGVSQRTVVRRAGLLFERLGAQTRFQAGVLAARRGWL